jgi:hypothetical protein
VSLLLILNLYIEITLNHPSQLDFVPFSDGEEPAARSLLAHACVEEVLDPDKFIQKG